MKLVKFLTVQNLREHEIEIEIEILEPFSLLWISLEDEFTRFNFYIVLRKTVRWKWLQKLLDAHFRNLLIIRKMNQIFQSLHLNRSTLLICEDFNWYRVSQKTTPFEKLFYSVVKTLDRANFWHTFCLHIYTIGW